MITWWFALAHAREPSLGELVMPLTPSEAQDTYEGLVERPGAGSTTWSSETPGFTCSGVGDWLEVEVSRATWPSAIPKKVTCLGANGKKAKVKVRIEAPRHEPMFVSDGTLVMPRLRGASVIYEGPPPSSSEVVVQQGKTADLYIHCDVKAGPTLVVLVDPAAKDGTGFCLLKDKFGETSRVPISIVTVR